MRAQGKGQEGDAPLCSTSVVSIRSQPPCWRVFGFDAVVALLSLF
jgi:hypothetical protein